MKPAPRQLEVLKLLGEGLTAKGIANALSISPLTVKKLVVEARRKLGASNSVQAVVIAIRRGYISLNGDIVEKTEKEETMSSQERSPFCYVCRHRVCDLERHQLTEEHRRSARRMIKALQEQL